jgi:lipid-binding SYLF domain-containing protein
LASFRHLDDAELKPAPPPEIAQSVQARTFIQAKIIDMKITTLLLGSMFSLLLGANVAHASEYDETIELFKHAGESAVFFKDCYAYAVFPTVGAGGLVVGGARGKGHVYVHDRIVGDTTMTQLSVGLQAGGKSYSQIIFFQNKRDLEEFESGKFEFNAGASAIAITASASASVGTDRASSEASRATTDATTNGDYQTGMAVFTIAKGGLMFAANIAGEKFSYKALSAD